MKQKLFFTTAALISMAVIPVLMAHAENLAKPKPPTPEEVQKYSETRGIIETRHGNIVLKFFPETAPLHVRNFIYLAENGFYDGTAFHRVIPGFMIQGGDPNSRSEDRTRHGTGGPGYSIEAEFSKLPHKRGSLSMARSRDPNSAGSQFFICVADSAWLDGQYTLFGEVIEGMEAADKIVDEKRDRRDNPVERVEMKVRIEYPQ
jgi:peptidyl-prolyl cis-trans isomerase B (cyclophilin B)